MRNFTQVWSAVLDVIFKHDGEAYHVIADEMDNLEEKVDADAYKSPEEKTMIKFSLAANLLYAVLGHMDPDGWTSDVAQVFAHFNPEALN